MSEDEGPDTPAAIRSLASDPTAVFAAFETADIGMVVFDAEDTVRWVSDCFETFFATTAESVVGSSEATLFESTIQPCLAPTEEAAHCGERWPDGHECRVVTDDSEERWLRYHSHPITQGSLEGGRLDQYLDVTAEYKRQKKPELKQSQEFLRDTQEAADIGAWEVDLQTETMGWTAEVYRIHDLPMEYDPSVSEGLEFYHPEDREQIEAAYERLITAAAGYDLELRIVTEADEIRWVRTIGYPLTEDGDVIGARGTFQDVTDRKERERQLEESRNHYRTLVDNFPNGAVTLVDDSLRYQTVVGTPLEEADTTKAELLDRPLEEVLPPELADLLVPRYVAALDGESTTFERRLGDRDYRFSIVPVRNDDEEVFAAMGMSQDITDVKMRERELEKRERILRELHAATREFYPPDSMTEVSEFIVKFIESAFEFSYVSVTRFDEETGRLRPEVASSSVDEFTTEIGDVEPGPNPIWEVYRTGESRVIEDFSNTDVFPEADATINQLLAVPVGNFGVVLSSTTGEKELDAVDVDLVEVLTTNAETNYRGLQSDKVRTALAEELSVQQTRVDELNQLVDTIQTIQRRVARSESREELEERVCAELTELKRVDFAWLGRPKTTDTDLRPTAYCGDGERYLDSIQSSTDESTFPAQRAATDREPYQLSKISRRVLDEPWAKEAVSEEFASVLSLPLVYDDVLYGVLTTYSKREDAFRDLYEELLTDVATLLINYSRLFEHRQIDSKETYTELQFEFSDGAYPVQSLATETESTISYDTITEYSDDVVTVIVTVEEGDVERVLEYASVATRLVDATRFGDETSRQLSLEIRRPFLASRIRKHGGRLVYAVTDATQTAIHVELPTNTSKRPLLDFLTSQYKNIDMVAQYEDVRPDVPTPTDAAEYLTERQYEILNAAYHGGYYETPRNITGEDLADSFDISSPAVYNHLQAAHRKLLQRLLG